MHEPRDPDHKPEDEQRRSRDDAQTPESAAGKDPERGKKDKKQPRDPASPTDDEIEDAGCECACAAAMSEGETKARDVAKTNSLTTDYINIFGYSEDS